MANLPSSNNDPYTYFYSNLINGNDGNNDIEHMSHLNLHVSPDDVLKDSNYIKYNSEIKEKQCPISLEEFKDGDSLIELPCNHIFLDISIKEWVKEKQSCPVCRQPLINVNSTNINYTHNEEELARSQW